MLLTYLYEDLDIFGESCPTCGHKSWDIFKCGKCEKIFCAHCRPDLVKKDNESENIEVTCECGSSAIFI